MSAARRVARRAVRPADDLGRRLAHELAALVPGFPHTPLCVAFSGGLDSTVLLTALAEGEPAVRAVLRAVHIDHGMHPDSAAWGRHCRRVARTLRVPIRVIRVRIERTRGVSPEAAARAARYAALQRELHPGEVLLTAHHAQDQLETVLLQLLRGAGVAGLAAMAPAARFAQGLLVRPQLAFERGELEAWGKLRRLSYIEDSSNADEHLDRNYLRRRVVPVLKARWPGVAQAVGRSARHAAEAQRLLEQLARADVAAAADGEDLAVPRLRALSADRRRNALRFWIVSRGHAVPDTARLAELAGPVLRARSDARPQVRWGASLIERQHERLRLRWLSEQSPGSAAPAGRLAWALRECPLLALPDGRGRMELAPARHGPVDLDALPDAVAVGSRRGGERLQPRRGGPRRSLKSLLQEERVAHAERAQLPLIYAGERLLAAGDRWLDASIQAGASTTRRARLIWHRP